ncbi:Flp pilus assembly protein CpaB [Xylophilus sp.]|uniref:Flp pilus assembly protein CpaB n=1 Tax=Xylophilus sp. TaxID=2653893 RepID=UPI0013B7B966|nr:Flp pilus assembly protein CpaB [Xylophilus sp.]KAF1046395.1 MAG: hypothetical protein GAK38_02462 [Xylophilus sp.]
MPRFAQIFAVVLVLLAVALGGYAWFLAQRPPARAPAPAAGARAAAPQAAFDVVVTTAAVPAGQPLKAGDLKVTTLPIDPPGAFRTVEALAGQVPVFDLGAGTPVLRQQLATGLANRVAEGERAVAVKVDEASAAGHRVRPGDYVDVFFLLRRDNGEIDRSQARLLLARKKVLAYGGSSLDGLTDAAPPGTTPAAQQQGGRSEAARTAVLAVPVAEINRLALGEAHGHLVLALRNPSDTTEPDPGLSAWLPPATAFGRPAAAVRTAASRSAPPLAPIDDARSGLALADLAAGGTAPRGGSRPAAPPLPRAPARTSAPVPQAAAVEFIHGAKRDTLRY